MLWRDSELMHLPEFATQVTVAMAVSLGRSFRSCHTPPYSAVQFLMHESTINALAFGPATWAMGRAECMTLAVAFKQRLAGAQSGPPGTRGVARLQPWRRWGRAGWRAETGGAA